MNAIKKIRIKNFKNLENVEVEIKPLTFLFGPNSSGKSSFIKAIMFLSKNLLPLNFDKTIYKLSDEVDLGSFKDIVTNNDISKSIVFEIDFEGVYDFPTFDTPEVDDEDSHIFHEHFEFLDEIYKDNFFKLCHKYINSDEGEFRLRYDEIKFNFTILIEFTNFNPEYNFSSYTIKDNTNLSKYKFVRKEKFITDEDGESGRRTLEQFLFLNDTNVSSLFNHHYGDFLDDLTILTSEYTFYPTFSLLKLNNFSDIISDWFNLEYRSSNTEKIKISENWNKFSESEKVEFYKGVLRFCYVSFRVIPKLIISFFSFKHLPITREIPKKIYLLECNNFNKKDYYGLLNVLTEEFYPREFSGTQISNIILGKTFESISVHISKPLEIDSNNEFYNISDYFVKSFYFNINKEFRRLGFNLFYNIDISDDVGRIFLIGKNILKMYMENASSGFIQVFPIIAFCKFLSLQDESLKRETEYTIDFIYEEINLKYDSTELIKKFTTFNYKMDLVLNFNTLFIEQPELHLHPKLQSQLAELFADTINKAKIEDSIFIETHSEHLIRKIQVLIANREIDRNKIGVYYFDNTDGSIKVKKMEIEDNGFFKEPWPNGFFDDSYNLSKELLFPNKN